MCCTCIHTQMLFIENTQSGGWGERKEKRKGVTIGVQLACSSLFLLLHTLSIFNVLTVAFTPFTSSQHRSPSASSLFLFSLTNLSFIAFSSFIHSLILNQPPPNSDNNTHLKDQLSILQPYTKTKKSHTNKTKNKHKVLKHPHAS